jgi:hypothetical protein
MQNLDNISQKELMQALLCTSCLDVLGRWYGIKVKVIKWLVVFVWAMREGSKMWWI